MLVEIRAAEGGDDAKELVYEQLKVYANLCSRRGL
jgi:protein subunit release factor A